MAFLKLVVLSLVILLASGKKGGSAVSVDDMRELLVSSMQTTIALTALVEQQTQKISDLTDFAESAEEEIKDLKSKIDALAADDEALEGKLAKEIEALKEAVPEKRR